MSLNPLRVAAFLFPLAVLRPPAGEAQDSPAAVARRLAATLSIAVDEYARGVSGGQVVSADELREARLLLRDAARIAERLPETLRRGVSPRLAGLLDATTALRDPEVVRSAVDSLRRLLADRLGVALDPLPERAPSLADGARVYATWCAACHGIAGSGDGEDAARLTPPPSDFTDRASLHGASPLEFFRKITAGVPGTAMPEFEEDLSTDERWAVALYVSGFRYSAAERAEGRAWAERACPECLVVLSDLSTGLTASDDSLIGLLTTLGGEHPLTSAIGFARTAAAADQLGGDRGLAARRATLAADSLVRDVTELAASGRWADADARTLEAYLSFERVERDVGARSARAVRAVEAAFAGLRQAVGSGSVSTVERAAGRARAAIGAAAAAVTEGGSFSLLFGQSLLIILREGIEAILIIGALIAFLLRAGAPERVREIEGGAAAAIIASLMTAALFATLIRVSASQQEALEGLTQLLASAVLFSAASWLVAKIEAQRWLAFVRSRMQGALRSGRTLALAGVAFLAVYREGVETVLFYGALFGTADSAAGHVAVAAGLAAGAGILAVVYVAIQRYGLRIPLKPFFAVTGALLTVMAVSFAGQGVAELQAAGWVPATPLNLPALPVLGVFPTVQTLAAQLLVAGAFLAAVAWIFWLSPPPAFRRSGS